MHTEDTANHQLLKSTLVQNVEDTTQAPTFKDLSGAIDCFSNRESSHLSYPCHTQPAISRQEKTHLSERNSTVIQQVPMILNRIILKNNPLISLMSLKTFSPLTRSDDD